MSGFVLSASSQKWWTQRQVWFIELSQTESNCEWIKVALCASLKLRIHNKKKHGTNFVAFFVSSFQPKDIGTC